MVSVLFVHGMGTFQAGWSMSARKALDDAVQQHGYAFFQAQPPSAQIQFSECLYDDKFEDALKAWGVLANDAGAQSILDLDWMKTLDTQPNFVKTHVLDVAQWYFLKPKRDQIINALASQILGMDLQNTHIVAHSLGTSVMQKTLQAIGSGVYPGCSSQTVKLSSLHMIANVSRILEDPSAPVYGGGNPSLVRPQLSGNDSDSFCRSYYSYHHLLDPFMWVKPFCPPPWEVPDFFDGTVRSTQSLTQVHNLVHYLSAPEVHIPLLRCLFGFSAITSAEEQQALASIALPLPMPSTVPAGNGIEDFLKTIVQNPSLFH